MLSGQERRDLLAMAASSELREDCRELRKGAEETARRMTPERLCAFLTFGARLAPARPPRPAFIESRMLL
ncbi:MAG: hypothetical protein KGL53_10345 [Elusimicrobia bacterium]|nr:hypothetical protein [Elusimicrobiota bacterium]